MRTVVIDPYRRVVEDVQTETSEPAHLQTVKHIMQRLDTAFGGTADLVVMPDGTLMWVDDEGFCTAERPMFALNGHAFAGVGVRHAFAGVAVLTGDEGPEPDYPLADCPHSAQNIRPYVTFLNVVASGDFEPYTVSETPDGTQHVRMGAPILRAPAAQPLSPPSGKDAA